MKMLKNLLLTVLCTFSLSTLFAGDVKSDEKPHMKIAVVNFKACVDQSKLGKEEQSHFEALRKQMENSLEEKENFAMIQVIDSGIGIPKENLKKIFSAFFTTKTEGNGFGLLEVYKVVSAHRGTIHVDSTIGAGTTFTIKIPK